MNHVKSQVTEGGETAERVIAFPSGLQPPPMGMSPVRAAAHDHNIAQKLITVTEDKALLCLSRNLRRVGMKRWVHPLSLLSTMLLALATSEFDKLVWMSPDLLKAIFIVSSIVTAGWLIWELMRAGRTKELPDVVDDIFCELCGRCEEGSPGARLHVPASSLSFVGFLRLVLGFSRRKPFGRGCGK